MSLFSINTFDLYDKMFDKIKGIAVTKSIHTGIFINKFLLYIQYLTACPVRMITIITK